MVIGRVLLVTAVKALSEESKENCFSVFGRVPVASNYGKLLTVFLPRSGTFDSETVVFIFPVDSLLQTVRARKRQENFVF